MTDATGEVTMTGGEEDEMMSGEGAGARSIAGGVAVAAVDTGGNATSSVSPCANIQYDLFLPQLKISNMHSLSSSGCASKIEQSSNE